MLKRDSKFRRDLVAVLLIIILVVFIFFNFMGVIPHLWRLGHSERDNLYKPIASGDFKNKSKYRLALEFEPRFTGPYIVAIKFGKKTLRYNSIKEPFLYFDGLFHLTIVLNKEQLISSKITRYGRSSVWMDQDTNNPDFKFIGEATLYETYFKAGKKYSLVLEVIKKDSRLDDSGARIEIKYSNNK